VVDQARPQPWLPGGPGGRAQSTRQTYLDVRLYWNTASCRNQIVVPCLSSKQRDPNPKADSVKTRLYIQGISLYICSIVFCSLLIVAFKPNLIGMSHLRLCVGGGRCLAGLIAPLPEVRRACLDRALALTTSRLGRDRVANA